MAYDFVVREDKLEQLQIDLTTSANTISGYVDDIYKKIADLNTDWDGEAYQAFVRRSETYRAPLERLTEVLNDFAKLAGNLGTSGNTLIMQVQRLLNVDERDVTSAKSGVQSTSSERAKDANGAYIPTEGDYTERLEIPSNTTLAKGQDCSVIGDALYKDTIKTGEILENEIDYLKAYKTAHMSEIMALPAAQRDATLNYINSQIVQREAIVAKIENATVSGYFKSDGAIYNATSYEETGNVVLGLGVSDQEAVDAAVKTAKDINSDLSELSSIGSVDAYMLDCGI